MQEPYTSAGAAEIEIALRRWLQANPASAPLIVEKSRAIKWAIQDQQGPYLPGPVETRTAGPSVELLLLWSKVDMPGMIRWADHRDVSKDIGALRAKALLMSHVPPATRNRWLAEAPSDDLRQKLLCLWAEWDPVPAMDAFIGGLPKVSGTDQSSAVYVPQDMEEVSGAAASGPFNNRPFNTCGFGLGALESYDFSRLPILPKQSHYDWTSFIKRLSDVDIGEAARFGAELYLRTNQPHRDLLLQTFSGKNIWPGTGGGVDLVFTALRIWVVLHPQDLATSIPTLTDPDLRNAFTWLLKYPQGGGPSGTEILRTDGPTNHAHAFDK
jgi:hypothetical protein